MIRCVTVGLCGILLGFASNLSAQVATLNGLITDQQRSPIAGAEVIAVEDRQRYWTPEDITPLATSRTNSEGEFSISVPTTGPVALVSWGPRHRMTKYKVNPETAQSVMIGMALEPGVIIRGSVRDRDSRTPVAGAVIGPLVSGLDTETQRALRVMPQWVVSGPDGGFEMRGVATDIAHQFTAQADGYITANVELSVGATEADLFLDKGGSSLSGEVYARDLRPATFANTIIRANGNGFDLITRADGQGRFAYSGLPGGTFSIEPLLGDSERASKVEVVNMPDDNGTSIALEVSPGYYIRGTTIDTETSAPAANVPVSINDRWTTSSANGTFTLGPIYQPLQLTVSVSERDGWKFEDMSAINEYNSTDGFTDVNDVTIRVQRQRILDVQFSNFSVTTQPVTVTVLPASGAAIRRQVTSSSAEIPVFETGTYQVYAVSGGLATELRTLNVLSQAHIPVDLTFDAASVLPGRLVLLNTDETTRAQTFRLSLNARQSDGEAGQPLYGAVSPRADGEFRFQAMPRGEYQFIVTNGSGTRTTSQSINLGPGPNEYRTVEWEAGNRISGRIVNPQGQPVPFAQVTLLQEDGNPLRVEAKEDGAFRAEDLLHDNLTGLIVEAAAFSLYRESNVALPADDKTVIMQPMGRLVIVVEAAPTSTWEVHVVRMAPWAAGAYSEQLVGQPIFTRPVTGGETLETGIGEEGKFRIVAINRSTNSIMVSESFDWAGERAKGQTIYLRSVALGSISGTVGVNDQDVEITAMNTVIPESVGRENMEFRIKASNGRYQLSGLPAGNYLVLGAGEASSSYALNVELKPGGTATANLDVVPMATVSGYVELAGEPLPGIEVSLVSETEAGSVPEVAVTAADGSFLFEGLTPDSYSVSAVHNSGDDTLRAATTVAVKSGDTPAVVRIDLTPPRPVLLTVAEGLSLSRDTPVHMMNLQSRQLTAATWTSDGLEANVPPGRYEVWSGDSVVGTAEVGDDGTGIVSSPQ